MHEKNQCRRQRELDGMVRKNSKSQMNEAGRLGEVKKQIRVADEEAGRLSDEKEIGFVFVGLVSHYTQSTLTGWSEK